MSTVVFLRGMNVGKRRLTNDELVKAFVGMGFEDDIAYQASGNVILPNLMTGVRHRSSGTDGPRISDGLEAALGYEVPVFVRSAAEVEAIASGSPFAGEAGGDGGKPQIIFLHEPTAVDLSEIFGADDRFEAIGTEIHWLPPGGLADSGPLQKNLDAAVGGTTVRALGTIERIARKLI